MPIRVQGVCTVCRSVKGTGSLLVRTIIIIVCTGVRSWGLSVKWASTVTVIEFGLPVYLQLLVEGNASDLSIELALLHCSFLSEDTGHQQVF